MMEDFVKRLIVEKDELNDKLTKLSLFITLDKFKELDKEMQDLLSKQEQIMQEYVEILDRRVEILNK